MNSSTNDKAVSAEPLENICPARRICIFCRYDIRGLDTDSKCPECGRDIELSLRAPLMPRTWRFGFLLLALWFPLFAMGSIFYRVIIENIGRRDIGYVMSWIPNVILACGFWFILQTPVRGDVAPAIAGQRRKSRNVLDLWLLWNGVLAALHVCSEIFRGSIPDEVPLFLSPDVSLFITAFLLYYSTDYLNAFGEEVEWKPTVRSQHKLGKRTAILFVLLGATSLVGTLVLITTGDYSPGPNLLQLNSGNWYTTILRYFTVVIWLFFIVTLCKLSWLAFSYWRNARMLVIHL